MRTFIVTFLLFSTFISSSISASPLDDARDAGYVVEQPNGYVKATPSASEGIILLAKDINERRREAYKRIAVKNGITPELVGMQSYNKRQNDNQLQ
jgi:uncharacterized protein